MNENGSAISRLRHAWNVFRGTDKSNVFVPANGNNPNEYLGNYGYASSIRVDRPRLHLNTDRTMVASLYNKIATDVAAIPIKHVRTDQNGRYVETIESGLNNCLSVEANLDQTGRELIFDAVISMFDEGSVAIVPVETSDNYLKNGSFDILSLRTGRILQWYPDSIKTEVYNENEGRKQEIILPKNKVAIVENPFYAVMNENGSIVKRLIRKMDLLDVVDEQSGSSKFNMIVQLPYAVKSEKRQDEAEKRIQRIENQLLDSKYGIAYADNTEKITQLNRPLENNIMSQVEYLTKLLYNQLGVSEEVFNGTADEKTTLNYYNSTIEPILGALVNEMIRKFLTKTARTQHQSLVYIRDPFRLVPVNELAELADKFTRNEIASSNEFRAVMGMAPVDDARADELRNKNINPNSDYEPMTTAGEEEFLDEESYLDDEENLEEDMTEEEYLQALSDLDDFDAQLDAMEAEIDEGEDEDE